MATRPFKPLKNASQIDGSELFRFSQAFSQRDRDSVSGRMRAMRNSGGMQIVEDSPQRVLIALYGPSNGAAYGWKEQFDDGSGSVSNLSGGMAGNDVSFPAYEVSGDASLANDGSVITWAEFASDGQSLLFRKPASGGGSSLVVTDGTISVNPTTEILVGNNVILSNPLPGVAQIDGFAVTAVELTAASNTIGSGSASAILTSTIAKTGTYAIVGGMELLSATATPIGHDLYIRKRSGSLTLGVQSSMFDAGNISGHASVAFLGILNAADVVDLVLNFTSSGTITANFRLALTKLP